MARLLLTTPLLLLILSLVSYVSAWAPRDPSATIPRLTNGERLRRSQNSRGKIVQRQNLKRTREIMAILERQNGGQGLSPRVVAAQPQSSPKVYPNCPGYKGLGYAHYDHWDFFANDIPGNPVYNNPNTEEACIRSCSAHQLTKRTPTPDSSCIGVTYVPNGPCYLKGSFPEKGKFQYKASDNTDLAGGCAAWANTVPAEMDAVCCNF